MVITPVLSPRAGSALLPLPGHEGLTPANSAEQFGSLQAVSGDILTHTVQSGLRQVTVCRTTDQIWGFPCPEPKGQAAPGLCGTKALPVNPPEIQSEVSPDSLWHAEGQMDTPQGFFYSDRRIFLCLSRAKIPSYQELLELYLRGKVQPLGFPTLLLSSR